jgi:hemin uptake protein HemP
MSNVIPQPDSSGLVPAIIPGSVSQAQTPTISAEQLLRGHREIVITHGDAVYRLRLTRKGKLILQK